MSLFRVPMIAATLVLLACEGEHEASKLRYELAATRNSLKAARLEVTELKKTNEALAGELSRMRRVSEIAANVAVDEQDRARTNLDLARRATNLAGELLGVAGTGRPASPAPAQLANALPVPTPSTPQQTRSTPPPRNEPSWNDVSAASDFYDARPKIASKCMQEWPGDARMTQYCVEKQSKAVAELQAGRPFGADERTWNRKRVDCAASWPDDFAMRVYCEQK